LGLLEDLKSPIGDHVTNRESEDPAVLLGRTSIPAGKEYDWKMVECYFENGEVGEGVGFEVKGRWPIREREWKRFGCHSVSYRVLGLHSMLPLLHEQVFRRSVS